MITVRFGFDKSSHAMLHRLKKQTGKKTLGEVVRDALKLYNMALKALARGGHILIEEKDGAQKEIVIPKT